MVVREVQGVAVRSRGLEGLRGNLPASPGTVFHHHRIAQQVLELVGQRAGNGIGAASRWKAHQQVHRRALGPCACRQAQGGAGQGAGQGAKQGVQGHGKGSIRRKWKRPVSHDTAFLPQH